MACKVFQTPQIFDAQSDDGVNRACGDGRMTGTECTANSFRTSTIAQIIQMFVEASAECIPLSVL